MNVEWTFKYAFEENIQRHADATGQTDCILENMGTVYCCYVKKKNNTKTQDTAIASGWQRT